MSYKSLVIFLLVCFYLFVDLFFCSFWYISLFQFFTKIIELIDRQRAPWFKISQKIPIILLKWFAEHCQTIWFRRQKYYLLYSKFMQVLDQKLREWRSTEGRLFFVVIWFLVAFSYKIISIQIIFTSNVSFINPWRAHFSLKYLKKYW